MAAVINGEALRTIRERTGYKNSTLASRAGISPSYLTELENGTKPGSVEVIRKLADALGCPLGALLQEAVAS